MGRAAHAHAACRARWALIRPGRLDQAPAARADGTLGQPATETPGRPTRPERVTIADDGTRTEKGKGACVWIELDGLQLFSLPGDVLDKFTNGAADAFTPPVGYALQVSVLSTPTSAEAAVARAFSDARPPTAALSDLTGRLRAW